MGEDIVSETSEKEEILIGPEIQERAPPDDIISQSDAGSVSLNCYFESYNSSSMHCVSIEVMSHFVSCYINRLAITVSSKDFNSDIGQ